MITPAKNCELKKTIITEQMAKITRRNSGQEISKLTGEGEWKHAYIPNNILKHFSGNDFKTKSRIQAKLID